MAHWSTPNHRDNLCSSSQVNLFSFSRSRETSTPDALPGIFNSVLMLDSFCLSSFSSSLTHSGSSFNSSVQGARVKKKEERKKERKNECMTRQWPGVIEIAAITDGS